MPFAESLRFFVQKSYAPFSTDALWPTHRGHLAGLGLSLGDPAVGPDSVHGPWDTWDSQVRRYGLISLEMCR